MPPRKLYISQAALKHAKDSKDGVDKEIASLQASVEVHMPYIYIYIYCQHRLLSKNYFSLAVICLNCFLSNRMQKLKLQLQ